jgi:hypothetical protein
MWIEVRSWKILPMPSSGHAPPKVRLTHAVSAQTVRYLMNPNEFGR